MAEKEYIEREAAIQAASIWNGDESTEAWIKDALQKLPAADVVPGSDFRDCRNELCLRCGDYKQRHLGACDGCRWRDDNG